MKKPVLAFIMMLLPMAAMASVLINGIYYELSETEATLIAKPGGYAYYSGKITIPSNVRYNSTDYRVTAIDNGAFLDCTGLTSVTIPNSVKSIGNYTFYGCDNLTSMTIPNSVASIGNQVFYGCTRLNYIAIPYSVTSIGMEAFYNCSSLTSIIIPSNVGSIGQRAFYGCTSLEQMYVNLANPISFSNIFPLRTNATLYVPYGCKAAYEKAVYWQDFNSIEETIVFDDSEVKEICFANWDTDHDGNLSKEEVAAVTDLGNSFTQSSIRSFNELQYFTGLTTITTHAFGSCKSLSFIAIPNSVTSIGEYAFYNCTGLNSITIPNSVTSIGGHAFYGCSDLTSIKVESGNSVYDSRSDCNAIIKSESNELIYGCKNTIIPNSVTSIGENAFYNCSGLTSITIPNSVTSIGKSAFYNCSGLTSITIPNSVTSIGSSTFFACSGLTSITIPNSVTSIGEYAFYGCSGLTSITIPNSVTSIGQSAFLGCSGLTSITIPNSVTSIGSSTFSGCSGLTSITIPNSVTSIGQSAFRNCSSLTSITIPNSVTRLGNYAFERCSNLSTIEGGEGVTNVDYGTFYSTPWLTNHSSGILYIGKVAIQGKNLSGDVAFEDGTVQICDEAFRNQTGITSIHIPNSVTYIGVYAFSGCTNMTTVYVDIKHPLYLDYEDDDDYFPIRRSSTLYVPYGCKAAYEAADYWSDFKEILEMNPTELDITIGEARIATYCSEFDLDFTETDVKAYIVSAFTPRTGKVILTRIYDVPAGTGIIVMGDAGEHQIPIVEAQTVVSNMLVGVTEATELNKVDGDYTNYIFARKNGELGFYAVADGSTLGAHKAYLPLPTAKLPSSAEVKVAFTFDDDGVATGIDNVNPTIDTSTNIYTISGQRLNGLRKGLNIVDGKKVYVK